MEKRVLSEQVLYLRDNHYRKLFINFLETNKQLKEVYGGKIPGTVKKRLMRDLKKSGFTLEPGKGWSPPNSVDLSSLHSKDLK
jgi:hypothetical protein